MTRRTRRSWDSCADGSLCYHVVITKDGREWRVLEPAFWERSDAMRGAGKVRRELGMDKYREGYRVEVVLGRRMLSETGILFDRRSLRGVSGAGR
jgi:hypothetical protein